MRTRPLLANATHSPRALLERTDRAAAEALDDADPLRPFRRGGPVALERADAVQVC